MHELRLLPQEYTSLSVLGKSLAGIDIPVLHITDFSTSK
jgi:cytosolic carboxypeptidase protein 2/3